MEPPGQGNSREAEKVQQAQLKRGLLMSPGSDFPGPAEQASRQDAVSDQGHKQDLPCSAACWHRAANISDCCWQASLLSQLQALAGQLGRGLCSFDTHCIHGPQVLPAVQGGAQAGAGPQFLEAWLWALFGAHTWHAAPGRQAPPAQQ